MKKHKHGTIDADGLIAQDVSQREGMVVMKQAECAKLTGPGEGRHGNEDLYLHASRELPTLPTFLDLDGPKDDVLGDELDDELLDDDMPRAGDQESKPARNAERAIREAELADAKRFIRITRIVNPMAMPAGSERWARENVDRIYDMRLTGPLSSQRHEAVHLWHHRERKRLAKMPNLIEGEL